ncbi:MAG TPA: methyltransferase domain-containing protein [Vicinamibacterales bacterium]|nr:methyltransferase domain-containing protein [Vicinamibacterales bacterium]
MFRLRKFGPSHATALAMVGAKAGQSVVVLGADGPLAAAIGLVTGLNGRTVVVDATEGAAARVQAAADNAGALLEFVRAAPDVTTLDAATFDVAVLRASLASRGADERATIISEAFRVTRDGGRVVVIEGAKRGPVFGGREPRLDSDHIQALLTAAGGRAVRQLADVDHVVYVEARK